MKLVCKLSTKIRLKLGVGGYLGAVDLNISFHLSDSSTDFPRKHGCRTNSNKRIANRTWTTPLKI